MTRTRYRVTAACVSVKTASGISLPGRSPFTYTTLYKGATLPSDVPEDDVRRLLGKEAIVAEEVEE